MNIILCNIRKYTYVVDDQIYNCQHLNPCTEGQRYLDLGADTENQFYTDFENLINMYLLMDSWNYSFYRNGNFCKGT